MTGYWFRKPSSRNSCTRKLPTPFEPWLNARPKWLEVRAVGTSRFSTLAGLDPGEAARRQLIVLDDALVRLQATDFRYTPGFSNKSESAGGGR